MNKVIFTLIALIGLNAWAAVEFRGGNWHYGGAETLVIKNIGVITTEQTPVQVAITFNDNRQMVFTDGHIPLGLSLMPYFGKCVKVIPGYMFKSVNVILNCAE